MRVLFSTTAGTGHFGPLIPFARACAANGHTVAVAAPGRFAETVTGAGFDHLAYGEPPSELIGQTFARIQQLALCGSKSRRTRRALRPSLCAGSAAGPGQDYDQLATGCRAQRDL